jgi:3-deoxy-D-manno-octulosonate 8-phosphate phosphatase (KDO 8-P phosphatase)
MFYKKQLLKKAKKIRLLLFDVDGVLTDGRLFLGDDGQEYKAFHSQDGLGMMMLQRSGVKIGVITGRTSAVVQQRMVSLNIEYIFQGQLSKLSAFKQVRDTLELTNTQVAFVGDDVIDLPVMQQVGLAVAVDNAHGLVKKQAHWCTKAKGGAGAARAVCELIMHAQGTWDAQLHYFDE